jgi:hypothetical protein
MSGFDMLINSVLKSVGFSKEQFDATVENAKEQYGILCERANNIDSRVAVVENQVSEILRIVKRINDVLMDDKIPPPLTVDNFSSREKGF